VWSKRRALVGVNDVASGKPWITFAFDPTGHLKSFIDRSGLSTAYSFGPPAPGVDAAYLLYVSNLYTEKEGKPNMILSTYGYHVHGQSLLMDSITVPSPTGSGVSTALIGYTDGKVAAHVDANGNQRCYTYTPGHTRVEVKEPDGKVVTFFIQNLDSLGRNIGTTNAAGATTHIGYKSSNGAASGDKP
jgi:YD repeat-containing protein